MSKAISFLCSIFFILNASVAQGHIPATDHADNKHVLAIWLWGDNADASATAGQKEHSLLDLVTQHHVQREFFHRIIENGINRIYLNVNTDNQGTFIFANHHSELSHFISQAHTRKIEVFALFGDTAYVDPSSHPLIIGKQSLLEAIFSFNRFSSNGFDGIQSDIEPYYDGISGSPTDLAVVGPDYLAITAGIAEKISSHRKTNKKKFVFEAAIPFWYGLPGDDGHPPRLINYGGVITTMDRHILQLVDSVAVMAYRDTAEGNNGVIALAEPTMKIAEELGKDVLIALETQKPNSRFGVTGNLTLFEEGRQGLKRMLTSISSHYAKHPSYRGIALHHYDSLLQLGSGRILDTSLLARGIIWTNNYSTGVRLWDISGNYGHYGNFARDNFIHSAEEESRLRIDVDARGAWGSGISFLFSAPENLQFLDASNFRYIDIVWCSTVESVLQLADERWHALDDSVPVAQLPATHGKPAAKRIVIGKTHPLWGTDTGEDPRLIYSGSDEYGWIDRSRLASMFLRIPAPQTGSFELIEMRFASGEFSALEISDSDNLRACKPDTLK